MEYWNIVFSYALSSKKIIIVYKEKKFKIKKKHYIGEKKKRKRVTLKMRRGDG